MRILRSRLGRIIRDIGRKIEGRAVLENAFVLPLSRASQIRSQQQRQHGWKLYSFHAPEVECRFIPLKSAEQLDLQALHRVRSRLVTQRTAVINQIRGFLLERGLPVRQGAAALRLALPQILSMLSDNLSPRVVQLIQDLAEDWRFLERRVASITKEIDELADQDAHCRRLMSAPGVGPIISSAMIAAIETDDAFHKGRDFAAWLGLAPKQTSTGDRTILGRISMRGNRYLRTLFIQGARAVLLRRQSWPRHGFGAWLEAT
ncbi:hypothetical protein CVM73_38780 [Bradyrhizobium forestalis]|uniref:Transposase IS116/IS110/IS902 C-terminal domain-containing protein n=1 Tax=Bradyrhizobium forestalis TaxID=1419263 RepID=A0A2M8QWS7_9BRAD|nr:hypothetical protein CVM73_38780 [Bradyrhizobium forestalis]